MKYKRIGKHGLKLSRIGLGTWISFGKLLNLKESKALFDTAIENGITFFDTADIYEKGKAEEFLGTFAKDHERSDLVISSKVFWIMSDNPNDFGLTKKHIHESIDKTLARLQMDYLDIYFCHHFDLGTPLEETVFAMNDLIEAGKILHWGTSVWTAHQIERVQGIAKQYGLRGPIVEQPRYNMIDRSIELHVKDTLQYHGMGLTPWSPLHYGVLTGKYNKAIPENSRVDKLKAAFEEDIAEENLRISRELAPVAKELDITQAQLALAWLLHQKPVTAAITGASKPEHIESNSSAVNIELSDDTLQRIEAILNNKPIIQYPYTTNQQVNYY